MEGPTHGCEVENHPSEDPSDAGLESENHKVDEPEESEAVVFLQDRIKWLEQHVVKKVNYPFLVFGFLLFNKNCHPKYQSSYNMIVDY